MIGSCLTAASSLLAPNQANLIKSLNVLRSLPPNLLFKYNPEYTCLLLGAKWYLDNGGGYDLILGGNAALRRFWTAPSCSVTTPIAIRTTCRSWAPRADRAANRDVARYRMCRKNYPVRPTDHQHRLGHRGGSVRPNPGIGFPGYADYLPVTRGNPPSHPASAIPGWPGAGPHPVPGRTTVRGPAVRARRNPAISRAALRTAAGCAPEPGRTPGSEPFVVPAPGVDAADPDTAPPLPQAPSP